VKYYILNIVVIVIFIGFYTLTMIFDNEILYLGSEDIWSKIATNNKLPIHSLTYLYILPIVCILVYVIQRIKHRGHSLNGFVIASLLSIGIIYLSNYFICQIINSKVWNLYFYPRVGVLVWFSLFVNLVILVIGIPLCEKYIIGKVMKCKRNDLSTKTHGNISGDKLFYF
jgi:hypothetical protein